MIRGEDNDDNDDNVNDNDEENKEINDELEHDDLQTMMMIMPFFLLLPKL